MPPLALELVLYPGVASPLLVPALALLALSPGVASPFLVPPLTLLALALYPVHYLHLLLTHLRPLLL